MIKDEQFLWGSKMYTNQIARMGQDYFLDQVKNHALTGYKVQYENMHLIATQEILTLTSVFAVRYSDLDLLGLPHEQGSVRKIVIGDTAGHLFARHINLENTEVAGIMKAVNSAAPHIMLGYSPENQIAYKERHGAEITANLRQLMQMRNGNNPKMRPAPEAGELIFSASSTHNESYIFVTDLYLMAGDNLTGKRLTVNREEVEWIFAHRIRRAVILQIYMRDGKDYLLRLNLSVGDLEQSMIHVASLLPNAAVLYTPECQKWWISRHGQPGKPLWRMF